MSTFGLTPTGFVAKTREDAKAEMEAAYKEKYGPNINLDPATGVRGRRIGIQADQIAQVWEAMEAVNAARDPDAAQGPALDADCALTGTLREGAAPSTVNLTCTGVPGTLLAALRQGEVSDTGAVFETGADATIAALPVWSAGAFLRGAAVANGGNAYRCIAAGDSVTGPSGTAADSTDGGTAHWRFLGVGAGLVQVDSESLDFGPVAAISGSIITIKTPVSGWTGVVNELDAAPGRLLESDPALRLRRYDELGASDGASFESLRAALFDIDGVTAVRVFFNRTNLTDGDGLPSHTVECLVLGGADQAIRETIAAHTVCTASTFGTTSGTIMDSEGHAQTILFSRPTAVPIYVDLYLEIDASKYPSDGDARAKVALAAYGNSLGTGYDARYRALMAQALVVAGVLDADGYINTVSSPVFQADLPITVRQMATYDTSRINVHVTAVTP